MLRMVLNAHGILREQVVSQAHLAGENEPRVAFPRHHIKAPSAHFGPDRRLRAHDISFVTTTAISAYSSLVRPIPISFSHSISSVLSTVDVLQHTAGPSNTIAL